MQIEKNLLRKWKRNLPPPPNNPFLNDMILDYEINGVEIWCEIFWHVESAEYRFQFIHMNDSGAYLPHAVTLKKIEINRLRAWVKRETGVDKLHQVIEKAEPTSYMIDYGTLPDSLRPRSVKII